MANSTIFYRGVAPTMFIFKRIALLIPDYVNPVGGCSGREIERPGSAAPVFLWGAWQCRPRASRSTKALKILRAGDLLLGVIAGKTLPFQESSGKPPERRVKIIYF